MYAKSHDLEGLLGLISRSDCGSVIPSLKTPAIAPGVQQLLPSMIPWWCLCLSSLGGVRKYSLVVSVLGGSEEQL